MLVATAMFAMRFSFSGRCFSDCEEQADLKNRGIDYVLEDRQEMNGLGIYLKLREI